MKRDMDLIKAILENIEKNCDGVVCYNPEEDIEHYTADKRTINEHCRLIAERGLSVGNETITNGFFFHHLTWDGHDFLDNARESKVWDAAKRAAGNLSFGVFQEVLIRAATSFALNQLGLQKF